MLNIIDRTLTVASSWILKAIGLVVVILTTAFSAITLLGFLTSVLLMTTYEYINGQGFHLYHNLEKETLKGNDELQLFLKKFCTSYKISDLDEEEEFTVERRTVTCPEEAASLDRMYGDKDNEAA